MEEGQQTTQSAGTEWPAISAEERILYETLFYSQGPVDGYLLGEGAQDLFLKSGLSLRVLSQIWNLADVSHDNVMNVHEFVVAMHLTRGLLRGLKLPPTLPRKLTPPKTDPVGLQAPTPQEKEAYAKLFEALDVSCSGVLDGEKASHVFLASGLTREVLAHVWNLSDVNRDGKLDVEEFCLACHLLRYIKAGNSLAGPVDVFRVLQDRIASHSLQARKQRVQKYEQHKQKLMSLKEKRRQQVIQENKRLQLHREKLELLQQLYKLQKKTGKSQVSEETFRNFLAREKEEEEHLEEIVNRLKREHEKVRQETVKIILAEQKLSNDIQTIKKDTDELNKKLSASHTHATKDPDPFHQLYEERKEKRQGSTIKDLDKINAYYPFDFSPFDPGVSAESVTLGARLFQESDSTGRNNHPPKEQQVIAALQRLGNFGEEFLTTWGGSSIPNAESELEEDTIFKEVPASMESERWLGLQWEGPGPVLDGEQADELHEKLVALKAELQKLNEPGTRLLFKNPEDYLARKKASEEEEKSDRTRFHRRSVTERRSALQDKGDSPLLRTRSDNSSPRLRDRHSYTERNDDVSQAVREYRQKRQSAQSVESSISASSSLSSSPRSPHSPKAPERPSRSKRPLSTGSGLDSPRAQAQDEVTSSAESPRERSEKPVRSTEETAPGPSSPVRANRPKDLAGIVSRSSPSSLENAPAPSTTTDAVVTGSSSTISSLSARSVSKPSEVSRAEATGEERKPESQREKSPEGSTSVSPNRPSSKKTRAPPPPPEAQSPRSSAAPAVSSTAALPCVQEPIAETVESSKPSTPSGPSSAAVSSAAGESKPLEADRRQAKEPQAPSPSSSFPPSQESSEAKDSRLTVSKSAEATVLRLNLNFDQPEPESPREPKDKPSPERPARPKRRKDGNTPNPTSPNDAPQQPEFSAGEATKYNGRASGEFVVEASVKPAEGFGLVENFAIEEEEVPEAGGSKTASPCNPAPVSEIVVPSRSAASTSDVEPLNRTSRKGKAPSLPAQSPAQFQRDGPASPPFPPSLGAGSPSTTQNGDVKEVPVTKQEEKLVEVAGKSLKTKAQPPRPLTSPATEASREKFGQSVSQEETPETGKSVTTENSYSVLKSQPSGKLVTSETPAPVKETSKKFVDKEILKPKTLNRERSQPPAFIKIPLETVHVDSVPATLEDFEQVGQAFDKEVETADSASDRGRTSETSSLCDSDADNIPPPLPSTAPPPLPTSPPPSASTSLLPLSAEEVIEVRQVVPTRAAFLTINDSSSEYPVEEVIEVRRVVETRAPRPTTSDSSNTYSNNNNKEKMEEAVLIEFHSTLPESLPETSQESQKKTVSDLRAELFGLDPTGEENSAKVTGNNLDLLEFDTLQPHNNRLSVPQDDILSGDSDLSSDEKGFEGTFSPGDSGVMMSSIPTSPDGSDGGRIQLVSYKTEQTQTQPKGDPLITTTTSIITTTKTQYEVDAEPVGEPSAFFSVTSRPQSLQMKESSQLSPTADSPHNSSTTGSVSPQDMAALSPRSREIFEKARHFADMVQKPSFVAKRDHVTEEEFSKETLQDFEMERRAVISQSTVRRKDVKEAKDVMSPTRDYGFSVIDTVEPATVEASVTSHEELQTPTPERNVSPTPEARWTDRHGKISLYSENVVQEPESSEAVDRESVIANLAITRKQWETVLTTDSSPDSRKPKKNKPKWEVRMPYAEKKVADANTVSSSTKEVSDDESPPTKPSSKMADAENESAIEREIRLAMEREEMMRKEQEERMRLVGMQQERGGLKPSSMQSSTESELQPSYHELTEADRGAEFLIQDRVALQEDAEQEEALQRGSHPLLPQLKYTNGGKGDENPTESIIEREIRLQREREAELAKQRGGYVTPPASNSYSPPEPEVQVSETQPAEDEVDSVPVREIEYEEAISQYQHEGESRIAQELRELREREEEMRRMREAMSKAPQQQQKASAPAQSPVQSTPPPPKQQQQPKTVSTSRTPAPSTPSAVNSSTTPRGKIHASPQLDTDVTPKNETPTPKQETPIEREIRLARERENELRRAKGLPELEPQPEKQEASDVSTPDFEMSVGAPRRYYAPPQPDSTMRKFATSRLQQEIIVQRNREMALRQEGKIITTSEEHIQPLKYSEVIGGDKADGPVKRSFRVPTWKGSKASQENVPESTPARAGQQPATTPGGATGPAAAGKKGQPSGASFSYREFKQTAESKIERELREMREREEELRKQRGGGTAESGVAAQ